MEFYILKDQILDELKTSCEPSPKEKQKVHITALTEFKKIKGINFQDTLGNSLDKTIHALINSEPIDMNSRIASVCE